MCKPVAQAKAAKPPPLADFRFERRFAPECSTQLREEIRKLHQECYPTEHAGRENREASLDEWWRRVHFTHEQKETIWFLLWRAKSPGSKPRLIAMASVVPYADSLYAWNLGVAKAWRGIGLAQLVLLNAQAFALSLGIERMTGTVEAGRRSNRLLAFYLRMSCRAEIECNAFGSTPSTCTRIVDTFNADSLQRSISEHARRVSAARSGRDTRRSARRRFWGLVVGSAAGVLALDRLRG